MMSSCIFYIQSISYMLVLGISIYIYIYKMCIIEVNYAINRIHEKAFRSDLSTQIKKSSSVGKHLLRISFPRYLFVPLSFITCFL